LYIAVVVFFYSLTIWIESCRQQLRFGFHIHGSFFYSRGKDNMRFKRMYTRKHIRFYDEVTQMELKKKTWKSWMSQKYFI